MCPDAGSAAAVSRRPRRVLVPVEIPAWRAPGRALRPLFWEGRAMGTYWRVSAFADSSVPERCVTEIRRGIERRLNTVVVQMSHYQWDSDLSRYNRARAGTWVTLPDPFFDVLRCAVEIAAASQGWFDPTLGECISLWGFGAEPPVEDPAERARREALRNCGWERLKLDTVRRAAWQPGGLKLNLSAIAKGFAVDDLSRRLQQRGIVSALVDIGGELRGWGVKPDGTPWWVRVENPPYDDGSIAETLVALCGLSIASSGDWMQWRRAGQRLVCHLMDPTTGAPIEGRTCGAAVIHDSCMVADAWATALCVAPPRAAMRLAGRHGLAARLIYRKPSGRLGEWLSPAMQAMAR